MLALQATEKARSSLRILLLPDEILLQIVAFMDYSSLCAWEKTCSFIRKDLLSDRGYTTLLMRDVLMIDEDRNHMDDDFIQNVDRGEYCQTTRQSEDSIVVIRRNNLKRMTATLKDYLVRRMKQCKTNQEKSYQLNYLIVEEFQCQSMRDLFISYHIFKVDPFMSWRKVLEKPSPNYRFPIRKYYEQFIGLPVHWKGVVVQNINNTITCYLYDDNIFNLDISSLPLVILKNVKNPHQFKYLDLVEFIAEIEYVPSKFTNRKVLGIFQSIHSVIDQFGSTISQVLPAYQLLDQDLKSSIYTVLRIEGNGTLIRKMDGNTENLHLSVSRYIKERFDHYGETIKWNTQILWRFALGNKRFLIVRSFDENRSAVLLVQCEHYDKDKLPRPGDVLSMKARISTERTFTLKKFIHFDRKSADVIHSQLRFITLTRIILQFFWFIYMVFALLVARFTGYDLY